MIEEDIKRAIGRIVRILDPYFFNRYQNIGLKADRSMFIDGMPALLFIRADKDGDGDYDPLTSTSWDGDGYAAGTGTIDWNTVFGVPTTAKAVFVKVIYQSAAVGRWFGFKAKSTTTSYGFSVRTQVANVLIDDHGIVPIAADGTSFYSISDTTAIYLFVVGWYI